MTMAGRLTDYARVIRLAVAGLVVAAAVLVVALHAFDQRYGEAAGSDRAEEHETVLAAAIVGQQTAGRECTARPRLTDVVLFEQVHGEQVVELSFGDAVRAVSAREGVIRRYCS